MVCEAIRPSTEAPIDVHLMVKPVDRIVPDFARAGADIISFHPEASEHIYRTIGLIHEQGCKAGLVFNPGTPLDYLNHVLYRLDLVLIMSVNQVSAGRNSSRMRSPSWPSPPPHRPERARDHARGRRRRQR